MNIKYRMPKLGGDTTYEGIFKEIMLSVIATTISIILTFGTAQYIEEKDEEGNAVEQTSYISRDSGQKK